MNACPVSGTPHGRGSAAGSSRPDELVLALGALDQSRIDSEVVKLQRDVLGPRVATCDVSSTRSGDVAVGEDKEIGRLLGVLSDRFDGRLGTEGEGSDRAGVGAGLVASEGTELRQVWVLVFFVAAQRGPDGVLKGEGLAGPHRQTEGASVGRRQPSFLSREEGVAHAGRRSAKPLRDIGQPGARPAIPRGRQGAS